MQKLTPRTQYGQASAGLPGFVFRAKRDRAEAPFSRPTASDPRRAYSEQPRPWPRCKRNCERSRGRFLFAGRLGNAANSGPSRASPQFSGERGVGQCPQRPPVRDINYCGRTIRLASHRGCDCAFAFYLLGVYSLCSPTTDFRQTSAASSSPEVVRNVVSSALGHHHIHTTLSGLLDPHDRLRVFSMLPGGSTKASSPLPNSKASTLVPCHVFH